MDPTGPSAPGGPPGAASSPNMQPGASPGDQHPKQHGGGVVASNMAVQQQQQQHAAQNPHAGGYKPHGAPPGATPYGGGGIPQDGGGARPPQVRSFGGGAYGMDQQNGGTNQAPVNGPGVGQQHQAPSGAAPHAFGGQQGPVNSGMPPQGWRGQQQQQQPQGGRPSFPQQQQQQQQGGPPGMPPTQGGMTPQQQQQHQGAPPNAMSQQQQQPMMQQHNQMGVQQQQQPSNIAQQQQEQARTNNPGGNPNVAQQQMHLASVMSTPMAQQQQSKSPPPPGSMNPQHQQQQHPPQHQHQQQRGGPPHQQMMGGMNPAAAQMQQQQQAQQQQHMMHPHARGPQDLSPANVQQQQQGQTQQRQHQQPVANQQPGANNSMPPGVGGGLAAAQQPQAAVQPQQAPPGGHPGMRELRVEDALLYLDDVKREFKNFPGVYNEFLTIMKNFKTQEVDTPGVIARVSKLFRGYNRLILGFNTFLPDGYKISLADLHRIEAEEMAREQQAAEAEALQQQQQQRMRQQQQHPPQMQQQQPPPQQQQQQPASQQLQANQKQDGYDGYQPASQDGRNGNQANGKAPPAAQQQPEPTKGKQAGGRSKGGRGGRTGAAAAPQQQEAPAQAQAHPPQQQHQAVEFDHAISYVTTIKRRFANDPNTYHSFLEILHTYQKEQRGIKEVLEQVAHLFQDHPDLLKEFTFFLPDAVQDQAKERLHRAAAESEQRLRLHQEQMVQRQMRRNEQEGAAGAASAGGAQKFIDMTSNHAPVAVMAAGRKRHFEAPLVPSVPQQPESFVYNSAVERQFFDAAREALTTYTRDGGQAWAEFMKCLDMYAQEILSRTEMLNFVEPLLGKRNAQLFEEFKRILSAAGSTSGPAPPSEDSWYSVPLSEIDFSRCRRCSPSYRALPRDYPAPPCSERNDEEANVLNDIWVSLPVGSEESYTFRHMRRITYEEILFRCEDERFEIDMVIDCNAATLQRLLPVAEEIAQLAQEEIVAPESGVKAPEGAGISGKRFQYTFDKNILGVIHRNSISRIYGDTGPEMLDLLVKNPTVAVPLVVERLQQKDTEWRAVRDRLNLHWRELAEHNYYKSLDHRSLTWRTTDKRAISTRTLLAEMKDRAQNGGKEGKEALRLKIEKAKDEHGTFYEVTKAEALSQNLDLTFLPKPDRLLFTPHLSVMYENSSWAQRDAFRILSFALERGPISPNDKERCHRMWLQFLGPWFGLPVAWMQKPAAEYQEHGTHSNSSAPVAPPVVVSEEEESMDEEMEMEGNVVTEEMGQTKASSSGDKSLNDSHPLPCGTLVSTVYGEGTIVDFRQSDHLYVIKLGFGSTGYLRASSVLCSLQPVEPSESTAQLRSEDRTKLARPGDQLAIGTQSLFLFFRLHQILVKRLNTAKHLAYTVGEDKSLTTLVEQMPNANPSTVGRRRYEAYLALLYALLDGSAGGAAEGGKYEDRVRSLLGHGAYELATMDKLISHLLKNLQSLAQDETMWNLTQLYRGHKEAGSFQPEAFRQEAAYLSDHEPMYAFQICPMQNKDDAVMHMEYLGVIAEVEDVDDDDNMMEDGEVAAAAAAAAAASSSAAEDAAMETEASEPPPPPPLPPASKRQRR